MTRQIHVTLPPLHRAQRQIHDNGARFRVAACGRRFGKNFGAVTEELEVGLHNGKAWHIAPDYPTSEVHWRLLRNVARQLPGVEVREADKMLTFEYSDGFVQVKSAGATLRSEGLDLAVVDEAAHIADLQHVWQEQLRPALSDRQGRALFISSPYGLDYFYDLWQLGQDPHEHEWWSIQLPTSSNPYIKPSEVEAARKSLPDRVFRQEYLAEFIADGAGVFRYVKDVSTLPAQTAPIAGHNYVAGVDFGRSGDYTVISVLDTTKRQQVAMDRFTDISWQLQRARLKQMIERWHPQTIWAEENSFGGPAIEALQHEGLTIRPFQTTSGSKADIIDSLALAIEKGAAGEKGGITLLDDPIQVGELQAYNFERLPSGVYRYSAPVGKHDDTVMALALALHGCTYSGVNIRFG